MPIEFELDSRLAGFAASPAQEGESVEVIYRELIGPSETSRLMQRLEQLDDALFKAIPRLPPRSTIDHLLVILRPNLTGTAYVNELDIEAQIQVGRSVEAGEPIRLRDVEEVSSVRLGVEIPEDSGFVVVQSHGWKRSLMYDFGPIHEEPTPREYDLPSALAEQTLRLWGLSTPAISPGPEAPPDKLQHLRTGVAQLEDLLAQKVEDERQYQELLENHPWMLGGGYDSVEAHQRLDDRIPDFTGRRSYDLCHDVIEIKQPFLSIFRADGQLAAPFNDARNQLEGYLAFTRRQRAYLRDERGLRFENPQGILLIGYDLTAEERRTVREVETSTSRITVFTYDELLRLARNVVRLVEMAGERG